MPEQIIANPYKRIEALESVIKVIATWGRVDLANRKDKVKRQMPPCLRAEDVVRLVEGVM